MDLSLVWLTLSFWMGLVLTHLSTTACFSLLVALAGIWYIFPLRCTCPKALCVIATALGLWLSPTATPPILTRAWQTASAKIEILKVYNSNDHKLHVHCRIQYALDEWEQPLPDLAGKELSLILEPSHASSNTLQALHWYVLGKLKVTANYKIRFKVQQASALKTSSYLEHLKLQMLQISWNWRSYLQKLCNNTSANSMGRSLLLAMLGSEKANARVDYILGRMGLSHLTAISGLHFALISAFTGLLFFKLYTPWRLLAAAIASSIFLILCGPSASALRAWMMGLISVACLLTGRRYEAIHALSLTTLCWLLLKPSWSMQIGFVLSVYCTAIIIVLTPLLNSQENQRVQWWHVIKPWLALQGAIFVFTAPFLLYWFHSISWISIAANLVMAPLFAACFVVALFAAVLGFLLPASGVWLMNITCTLATNFLKLLSDTPNRLDQIWYYEMSAAELAFCLPWFLALLMTFAPLSSLDESKISPSRPLA